MGLSELEEQGVLLPEEEWGAYTLETTVREGPMLVSFLVATAGCVLMIVGDGEMLTWVGVVAFLVGLFLITWFGDKAVQAQRERVERQRAAVQEREQAEG